jgi:beta-glucanase (GH16 family)
MRILLPFSLLSLLILLGITGSVNGQTPINDMNWQIDTARSDEFNGTNVNTSKWHILDCPSGDCCNWGGGTAFEKGNVSDSAGILRFRIDGPGLAPIPCSRGTYPTGGIASDSANYSYGYFEIYAQLPGFYDKGVPCGDKLWPAFWMAYQKKDTSCITVQNEIDVMDGSAQYKYADSIASGWWYEDGHCSDYLVSHSRYISPVPLFTGFHKYAVEWLSNSLIFYFDDVPYSENYNSPTMVMHPLIVFIDQQLADTSVRFNPNTPFPLYYLIDYFRYSKLKLDCATSALMLTNADVSSYIYSVKSDITFGNGKDSISLSKTDVKYFRAVNSITVNGIFTAPLGCELGLMPTPCN